MFELKNFFHFYFFIFLFFQFSKTQYQYCIHLSGTGEINSISNFGTTGEYAAENTIDGIYHSESFLVNNETEILVFFGIGEYFKSFNIVRKYSLDLNQWMFVKGSKEGNQNANFSELNIFDKEIQIGARKGTKGIINEEIGIITFFGGSGYTLEGTQYENLNELWQYNISDNSFLVNRCNNCGELSTSIEEYYEEPLKYNESNIPEGRVYHEMIKINENEALIVGGYYYSSTDKYWRLVDFFNKINAI